MFDTIRHIVLYQMKMYLQQKQRLKTKIQFSDCTNLQDTYFHNMHDSLNSVANVAFVNNISTRFCHAYFSWDTNPVRLSQGALESHDTNPYIFYIKLLALWNQK